MKTLVIHAPSSKVNREGKRSFEETVKAEIGDGYAIARTEYPLISIGCDVIVLDNETKKRAEGKLVKLEHEGFTKTGMLRYNVHMENVRCVAYRPIPVRLNHRGIAII
jgi:hypothetical protein